MDQLLQDRKKLKSAQIFRPRNAIRLLSSGNGGLKRNEKRKRCSVMPSSPHPDPDPTIITTKYSILVMLLLKKFCFKLYEPIR